MCRDIFLYFRRPVYAVIWYLQLLKILLSKPTIPKLFAKQLGWQGALSRLFICYSNSGSTARWMTRSESASGQQLVYPLTADSNDLLSKRQRSASGGSLSLADDVQNVDFDCGGDDDPMLAPKLQFDNFLADPYRRSSGEDDELEVLKAMQKSESCTFAEGSSTPLMRSLSSTDWSQLRYEEADDKVASALKTMGLASTVGNCDNTDRIDQAEELSQNLLIVLFTILWRGIDSAEESAWKVLLVNIIC